jgi:hypothetical protein
MNKKDILLILMLIVFTSSTVQSVTPSIESIEILRYMMNISITFITLILLSKLSSHTVIIAMVFVGADWTLNFLLRDSWSGENYTSSVIVIAINGVLFGMVNGLAALQVRHITSLKTQQEIDSAKKHIKRFRINIFIAAVFVFVTLFYWFALYLPISLISIPFAIFTLALLIQTFVSVIKQRDPFLIFQAALFLTSAYADSSDEIDTNNSPEIDRNHNGEELGSMALKASKKAQEELDEQVMGILEKHKIKRRD